MNNWQRGDSHQPLWAHLGPTTQLSLLSTSYHSSVNATDVALIGGVFGVLIGAGAMLAFRLTEREQQGEPEPESAPLPPGATAVLSALRSGSAVVDSSEAVVWASPAAYAWGLVRDGSLADDEVIRAVRAVRSEGDLRTLDLEPRRRRRGGPRMLMTVRVAPLTSDLVVVLAEDRSEAARVDDVRRDFVANVSHELKTPAAALGLLSEALTDAADDPEAVRTFAHRAQRESTRLASLIQDLVALSRLEGAERQPAPELVTVDRPMAEAMDRVRTTALARQISVVRSGESGLAVLGSEAQLATALGNLLENAVNYSPDGARVVIGARAVQEQDGGTSIEVNVVDEGTGIAAQDVERVFERFYRADPARSRATGGTGLGLAIVKHVATNHGGTVSVRSVEGYGSTFTLRLPAAALMSLEDPS